MGYTLARLSASRRGVAPDIIVNERGIGCDERSLTVSTKGEDRWPHTALPTLDNKGVKIIFHIFGTTGIPWRIADLFPVTAIAADPNIGRMSRHGWIADRKSEATETDDRVM